VKELVLQFSTAAQDWKRWAPRFVRKDAGLIRPTRTAGLFLSPFNQFGLFLCEVNSQCFFDHAENFLRPNIGLERDVLLFNIREASLSFALLFPNLLTSRLSWSRVMP